MPFETEITAIWGCRGSGKTTLARSLIERHKIRRAVIIDPVSRDGCTTVGQVVSAVKAGEARVVLRNPARDVILRTIGAAYLESTADNPLYLVCDEAPAYLGKSTDQLDKIMFQGRHRAFGMLILGQRPTAVDAGVRSQAAQTYWLKLTDHRDLQVAAQTLGPEVARKLARFKEGQFVKHPD